jgi:hypothetical protein
MGTEAGKCGVPDQPRLYRETLSQIKKKKERKKKKVSRK